jgi:hypothetical protein
MHGNAQKHQQGMRDPSQLWRLITQRCQSAQANRATSLIETRTELLEDMGVNFVLRVASTLRNKPKSHMAEPAEGG